VTALPAAVLWDLDGTLVDTEPYWWQAEGDLVESFGGSWSLEQGQALIGSGLDYSAGVLQAAGVAMERDEIGTLLGNQVLDMMRQRVPWRPGVPALLHALHEAGVPQAIVTMSLRPTAAWMAEQLGAGVISVVISGDDVEFPKPNPDPYLRAAAQLGVDIRDCVAVEDSTPGTAAAMAAGAVTFGVIAHVPLTADAAHVILPDLSEMTVDRLSVLYSELRASHV